MARNYQPEYRELNPFTVKGHKITPRINTTTGVFSVELEDGEEVGGTTLDELKRTLADRLVSKKSEPKTAVDCFVLDSWNEAKAKPAVYVGKRKGNHSTWSSCYMFEVGPVGNSERQNLDQNNVNKRVLKPTTDLNEYAALLKASEDATKSIKLFLKANAFDPTGECK